MHETNKNTKYKGERQKKKEKNQGGEKTKDGQKMFLLWSVNKTLGDFYWLQ